MSSAAPLAAPLVETTEDRLRRELAQSSQAEARESLLREESRGADNARSGAPTTGAPPSSRPATRKALEGPLLTGGELVVARRTHFARKQPNCAIARNNGISESSRPPRRACFHVSTANKRFISARSNPTTICALPACRSAHPGGITHGGARSHRCWSRAGGGGTVRLWPGAPQYGGRAGPGSLEAPRRRARCLRASRRRERTRGARSWESEEYCKTLSRPATASPAGRGRAR